MGRVFVAESSDPSEALETLEPIARIAFDGVYFYLLGDIQDLHEATGQLIHPQTNAFFRGDDLDELERVLAGAFEPAVCRPAEWDQEAGTGQGGEVLYQRTSRSEVISFLRSLAGAARSARQRNAGVLFWGE